MTLTQFAPPALVVSLCCLAGCQQQEPVAGRYQSAASRYAPQSTGGEDPAGTAEPTPTQAQSDSSTVAYQTAPNDDSGDSNHGGEGTLVRLPPQLDTHNPESDGHSFSSAQTPLPSADQTAATQDDMLADRARIAELEAMVNSPQSQLRSLAGLGETPANASTLEQPERSNAAAQVMDFDAQGAGLPLTFESHVGLDPLIRNYERKRLVFERSLASYRIDHMMTLFKGFELLFHGTPETFNGLPERDRYAFDDFQRAADELIPALEQYLEDIASPNDENHAELTGLLSEAQRVAEMPPPGTGNRLLDFVSEMRTVLENAQQPQMQTQAP